MFASIRPFETGTIDKAAIKTLLEDDRTIAAIGKQALQVNKIASVLCQRITA
jgi:hypothetical protein